MTVQTIKRERSVKTDLLPQFEKLVVKKAEDQKLRNSAPVPESEEEIRKLPKNEQLKRKKEIIKKKAEAAPPSHGENPANVIL